MVAENAMERPSGDHDGLDFTEIGKWDISRTRRAAIQSMIVNSGRPLLIARKRLSPLLVPRAGRPRTEARKIADRWPYSRRAG